MSKAKWSEIASGPIFFERNRVHRVYKGGKLFAPFFGDESKDGSQPEEWVASTVKALNRVHGVENEGLSVVKGETVTLAQLMKECPSSMLGERKEVGVLVKILDSAIRLPVQAHPDSSFSQAHFNGHHGKTEMWLILDTRENAKIYYGFKEGVTREDFLDAVKRSEEDKKAMSALLNKLPAQKGDVYLIPAKMVHAIGCGCLILEVQEPTDYTIQPEAWCGDFLLNDYQKYLGLDHNLAMECFDFSVQGEEALKKGRKNPRTLVKTPKLHSEALIDYEDTTCFKVVRHRLWEGELAIAQGPSVIVVTEGEGFLKKGEERRPVKKGDYFFMPYEAKDWAAQGGAFLELVECLPPKE